MPTRERILDVALALFNDAGTAPISTNHIAAAAEISPGNLYYHFRNKEQIVQSLFERLFSTYEHVFALPQRRPPTLVDLRNWSASTSRCSGSIASPTASWRHSCGATTFCVNVGWMCVGVVIRASATSSRHSSPRALWLPRLTQAAIDRLADLCWLISEFWLPSLEVSGQPVDAPQLERGVGLMLQALNLQLDRQQL